MPRIPPEFIKDLTARTDIADLVSGYVRLTKRTGSNMFGLCPFHSEKTPSFSVNTEKQIYYCFGCHHGGDAIHFIMEIENLSYPDAIEALAKRVGLTVPASGESDGSAERRRKLLEINREAAGLFQYALTREEGEGALRYMQRRGITAETARAFGLGAAPDSWDYATRALRSRGYKEEELADAGLVKRGKSGGVYDAFRDRLMFPVIDVRGNVVGFSGRILGDGEPKYLNTAANAVYAKGRTLFGLNLAKKTKSGMLILVEGNIDVVSLHQAGIDCAVAPLGTAMTAEQAQLMRQYTQTVVLAYDGDEAGRKATQRATEILEKSGIAVRVLRLTGAKDPDEYIAKYGADAFRLLLDRSENHIEYRLRDLLAQSDLETDDGKLKYLNGAVSLLSEVRSAAEREVYGRTVAQNADITYDSVASEVAAVIRARQRRAAAREKRDEIRVRADVQPASSALRYKNEASAIAEQGVIRGLLNDPELFEIVSREELEPGEFTSPLLGKAFERLRELDTGGYKPSHSLLVAEMTPEEAAEITRALSSPFEPQHAKREMTDYITKIRSVQTRNMENFNDALYALQRKKQKEVMG